MRCAGHRKKSINRFEMRCSKWSVKNTMKCVESVKRMRSESRNCDCSRWTQIVRGMTWWKCLRKNRSRTSIGTGRITCLVSRRCIMIGRTRMWSRRARAICTCNDSKSKNSNSFSASNNRRPCTTMLSASWKISSWCPIMKSSRNTHHLQITTIAWCSSIRNPLAIISLITQLSTTPRCLARKTRISSNNYKLFDWNSKGLLG